MRFQAKNKTVRVGEGEQLSMWREGIDLHLNHFKAMWGTILQETF